MSEKTAGTTKAGKPGKRDWFRITGTVAAVLLTVLAVLALIFRDKLGAGVTGSLFAGSEVGESGEAFTYETSSRQEFALLNGGLVVVSGTGIQLLNAEGYEIGSMIYPLSSAACASGDKLCAVWNTGDEAVLAVSPNGEISIIETGSPVVSVTVNPDGWLAVVTEAAGHKNHVTVYDPALKEVYQWRSGGSYVLSARVSPNNRSMAVLSADGSGGQIAFFAFDNSEKTAVYNVAGEVIYDFAYISQNRICALIGDSVLFMDSGGAFIGEYSFNGGYLTAYEIHDTGFIALLIGKYRAGNAATLITLSENCEVLGQAEIYRELISLSGSGKNIAALYSDGLVLYSHNMQVLGEYQDTVGVRRVLLRNGSEAMLLRAYYAEIYKFKT